VIAFVFPGQGAQAMGMGVQLARDVPAARRVFEEASAAISLDLLALCRDGPETRLRETENTQPALVTVGCAVAAALAEHGVSPAVAAGLSLGEYAALVTAGSLHLADAVRVVRHRGRFMQEAATGLETAMAAVLGLPAEVAVEICAQTPGLVEAANFNAPGQVVIAGEAAAVEAAAARLRAAGARRVIPLDVSAPFHTSLMRPAADRLAGVLRDVTMRRARIPVIANLTARPVWEPEEIRRQLVEQVASPVRWEQSVRTMWDLGARIFVEAGPGTTLAGLIRRTAPDATVVSIQDSATLAAGLGALAGTAPRGVGAA
jgi:[acyl-carrier-protein] S-malonyltransferase